ncbi:hypothetical protein BGX12_11077 [Fibrobacter sp. UWR4]|nr:hypothetical protein BGX12_11077 [Fibrobacter sp. UWR4]PZW71886.1 hypothetical protein C8E88_100978 [Fibrobacter sp. UWR1]
MCFTQAEPRFCIEIETKRTIFLQITYVTKCTALFGTTVLYLSVFLFFFYICFQKLALCREKLRSERIARKRIP